MLKQHGVTRTGKIFFPYRRGIESCILQCDGALERQILINFKLHALLSSGNSTVPSLANSAA